MGKFFAIFCGVMTFILTGGNLLAAAIAAGAGGCFPENKRTSKSEYTYPDEYLYTRVTKLTHYPDGTVKKEEY